MDKALFLIDKALQLVIDVFMAGFVWLMVLMFALLLLAYLGWGVFLAYDAVRKRIA